MPKLTTHFDLNEFYVSASYPELAQKMKRTPLDEIKCFYLCQMILEPTRKFAGNPIRITSGKRSKDLNDKIGGSKTSAHRWVKRACGCDFKIIGGTKIDHLRAYEYIRKYLTQTVGECIIYFREDLSVKHIHVTLADGNDQNQFLIQEHDKPLAVFGGKWPQ